MTSLLGFRNGSVQTQASCTHKDAAGLRRQMGKGQEQKGIPCPNDPGASEEGDTEPSSLFLSKYFRTWG